MTCLLQIQDYFQRYLLQDDPQFQSLVVHTEKVSAESRLNIYHHAYHLRLIDALGSNFPLLQIYVGEELFETMSREYIKEHPSSFRSIRWFGDQFPVFLNRHPNYHLYPYLSELAQFEWSQSLAFDAADDTVLQVQEIIKFPPEAWSCFQFTPHSSLQRINLLWNIVPLWQSLSDDQTPPEPVKHDQPIPLMIWRRNLINRFYSMSEDEAWAIDALRSNQSFGEICEGLCQWHNEQDAGMRAASLLNGWITSGILSQVRG